MENLNPLVSVLLPVRQWRDTTLQAIESILAQTIESLEVLVIGQQNLDTLKQQLPADSRIIPVARQQPGIVGALNTGLSMARAPYIARMDDDDIAYPERLERQLELLKGDPSVQLCAARIRFVDQSGSCDTIRRGNRLYADWLNALVHDDDIRQACLIECPMPHPTLIAHRSIWQQLGGYRDIDGPEDYDLILRAMLNGIGMGKPDAVLQDWREHPDRLTYHDERYRREAFTRCRAWAVTHQSSGLQLGPNRGVWLCGTGRNARHWYDALQLHDVTVHGFVDRNEGLPSTSKRGRPVISYEQLPERRGDSLVITALTQDRAREELKNYFDKHCWRYGSEYVFGG